MGVATVLRERAYAEFGFDEIEPSALVALLVKEADIAPDVAESLAWGEAASPATVVIDRLSESFRLDPDLLSILLSPSSPDVVDHVLTQVVLPELNSEACGLCYDLEAGILGHQELDEEGLADLCLRALGHLTRVEEQRGSEDDEDPAAHEVETLIATFVDLDPDSRRRVLAFALSEATGISADTSARRTKAFARLRQDLFNRLLVCVFDQIATSKNAEMSERELAHRLNLREARALRRLPEQIREAILELDDPGVFAEAPLHMSVGRDGAVFRLSAEAKAAWVSLLEAERSPLLIVRPAA